ncbi:hypothetical protein NMG60_11037078 [Bertholletia excelsa]
MASLIFFSFLIIFSATSASSLSYSDHCASVVPDATPTAVDDFASFPTLRSDLTDFAGGEKILGNDTLYIRQKYISFRLTRPVYQTNKTGIYKIQAHLKFQSVLGTVDFELDGLWSKNLGKLCMVGSASWYPKKGKSLSLNAVLKLNLPTNSTINTSLITGRLESLDSESDLNYFEPIWIVALDSYGNYTYTLVSEEVGRGSPDGMDVVKNQSIGLDSAGFCSNLRRQTFYLDYNRECSSSSLNCTVVQGIGYLPQLMSLKAIQCSETKHKATFAIGFGNGSYFGYVYYRPFDPKTTLIAEGSWDKKKNQLCVVACRILNSTDRSPGSTASVGDCSVRLSLRYPASWTIRKRAGILGQIWSTKQANETGYFENITFGNTDNSRVRVRVLRYEYTEIGRVGECPGKKSTKRKERYPEGNSDDMRFDMSVTNSRGKKVAWAYAAPVFVGDEKYQDYYGWRVRNGVDGVEANSSFTGPLNISYAISFRSRNHSVVFVSGSSSNASSAIRNERVEISAEGIYNGETGLLCMVGCRKISLELQRSTNESMDCEIRLNYQFAPVNSKKEGYISGTIKSTRNQTDPLYFDPLTLSSVALYATVAKKTVWRMDLEITMVLVSNTLACVFVGIQLSYVKKNPQVLPLMSILMLVILTLGHMIPLVLNFEALFFGDRNRRNVVLGTAEGWLELNEVGMRLVTLVTFLLEFRLLQLAWAARSAEENQKGLWRAEHRTFLTSSALYTAGLVLVLLMNLGKIDKVPWRILRSYGGLVIDGFLLPQILLNLFRISTEKALAHAFYIGISLIRLVPHAYDLYRSSNYLWCRSDGTCIFANPGGDFYSDHWDMVIMCGGVVLAVIVLLQQRFGGRFFLPRRLREVGVYEKVPVVSTE